MTSISCPGSQNDVSVYGNLLFVSVESTNAQHRLQPDAPAPRPPTTRFRGIRIFDISNINNPQQVNVVQTCRGSHTHTLVRPKNDPNNVYIYVSGTSGVRARDRARRLRPEQRPHAVGNPSRWKIDVIKVPLADADAAAVVDEPAPVQERADRRDQRPAERAVDAAAPVRDRDAGVRRRRHVQHGRRDVVADARSPTQCHDITVYEEFDLAAGACAGNGLLIDISDPANPKRIDAVADPLFAYWHGATFSNDGKAVLFTDEWGGGNFARCRATDQLSWGADAIYEIVNKKLVFRSYYKLPVAQTIAENCVSHVGNLVPVAGPQHHGPGLVPGRRLADRLDQPVPAEGDRLLRSRSRQRDRQPVQRRLLVDVLVQRPHLRLRHRAWLRLVQAHADRQPDGG